MAASALVIQGACIRNLTLPFSPCTTQPFVGNSVGTIHSNWHCVPLKETRRRTKCKSGKVYAAAVVDKSPSIYTLPAWSDFEIGRYAVYWETVGGRPPASGELLTIIFNPGASNLSPDEEYGVGFNGGFNQPIMCGGEPRRMTRKSRGVKCTPFYYIKINVPEHALTLEFSFTDGNDWHGPYKLKLEIPAKWSNQPASFFNEGLAKALSHEGACDSAIYPDADLFQDRCAFPAGLIHEGGNSCDLDLVPGCTDPESPFFDPLANVDDGSCLYMSDGELSE